MAAGPLGVGEGGGKGQKPRFRPALLSRGSCVADTDNVWRRRGL